MGSGCGKWLWEVAMGRKTGVSSFSYKVRGFLASKRLDRFAGPTSLVFNRYWKLVPRHSIGHCMKLTTSFNGVFKLRMRGCALMTWWQIKSWYIKNRNNLIEHYIKRKRKNYFQRNLHPFKSCLVSWFRVKRKQAYVDRRRLQKYKNFLSQRLCYVQCFRLK
jgi:hypothetical protein